MNPKYIFLLLAIIGFFRYYFLIFLNIRYQSEPTNLKNSNAIIPVSAEHYHACINKSKKAIADFKGDIYLLALTLLFVGWGGLGSIESLAASLVAPLTSSGLIEGSVFFGIIILIGLLIDFIQKYYKNFIKIKQPVDLDTADNRSKTILCKDYLIYTVVAMVGIALFLSCFYALTYFFPSSWLWVMFVGLMVLIVGVNILLPLVKLINLKTIPLERDSELRQCLEQACEKADFSFEDISVVNKSIKSSHGNAYALGFIKKRVILYDTLTDALTPQEVAAVFLHEIGHHKLKHVWFQLAVTISIMMGFIVIFSQYVVRPEVAMSFGLSPSKEYVTLLMYLLFFMVISPFSNVIFMALKRRQEFKADEYSCALLPGSYLADALVKIGVMLQQELPFHHPLCSFLRHPHPTIIERVRALRKINAL